MYQHKECQHSYGEVPFGLIIASMDGCLNYEVVPNDGCSQLYVGDIEIRSENVAEIQISHEHKDEELVTEKE